MRVEGQPYAFTPKELEDFWETLGVKGEEAEASWKAVEASLKELLLQAIEEKEAAQKREEKKPKAKPKRKTEPTVEAQEQGVKAKISELKHLKTGDGQEKKEYRKQIKGLKKNVWKKEERLPRLFARPTPSPLKRFGKFFRL